MLTFTACGHILPPYWGRFLGTRQGSPLDRFPTWRCTDTDRGEVPSEGPSVS